MMAPHTQTTRLPSTGNRTAYRTDACGNLTAVQRLPWAFILTIAGCVVLGLLGGMSLIVVLI